MKPVYTIEDKKEFISLNNEKLVECETLTLFFDFFDMIRNTDREYATYEILLALQDEAISYEEATKHVPVLHLIDNSIPAILQTTVSILIKVHEDGKLALESALREQRSNEEPLFKTLFIRQCNTANPDRAFFQRFNIRKIQYPISAFGDFVSANINYINDSIVCCGQCDKCGTFYPIYRGGSVLEKNHFCPVCRDTVSGIIAKQKAKGSKVYTAYQSFYNRYYQQFKRLNKISYKQFKDYILIAGTVRDDFLASGNDDSEAYKQEVEKQIANWNSM